MEDFVNPDHPKIKELASQLKNKKPIKSELRWMVEPTPSGSKFTFMENFELPFGIIGKLICAVGQRTSENHVKEFLAKLKSLVEA